MFESRKRCVYDHVFASIQIKTKGLFGLALVYKIHVNLEATNSSSFYIKFQFDMKKKLRQEKLYKAASNLTWYRIQIKHAHNMF